MPLLLLLLLLHQMTLQYCVSGTLWRYAPTPPSNELTPRSQQQLLLITQPN